MTEDETYELCRWLIRSNTPLIEWPTRTPCLSKYAYDRPPLPDAAKEDTVRYSYCYREEVFWIGVFWIGRSHRTLRYHGPDDLLEDLETLMLMESL